MTRLSTVLFLFVFGWICFADAGFIAAESGRTTEKYIASQVARFPAKIGNLTIIERQDGFDVNGVPYADPEGKIVAYSYDVMTGDVTYIAQTPSNHIIKTMRAGSSREAITIATAVQAGLGWEVETATGKRLSGYGLSPLPKGFMVARESVAFWYIPGSGIKNIMVPRGYLLTPLQRGNVGATRYVLLEKEGADGGEDQPKRLFSALKAVGSAFGVNKKEDYALMNVDTGALYPLNTQAEGRNMTKLTACAKKRNGESDCSELISLESIYDRSGNRNRMHYYWRAHWLRTPSGPIAIAMENGSRDIYIINLKTGKKVSALHRGAGIKWFDVAQRGDGSVGITAGMSFTSTEEIQDVEALLKSEPAIK